MEPREIRQRRLLAATIAAYLAIIRAGEARKTTLELTERNRVNRTVFRG